MDGVKGMEETVLGVLESIVGISEGWILMTSTSLSMDTDSIVLGALSVFLQFGVFCALAAFTKDFDIGYKLTSDSDEAATTSIQLQDGFTTDEIDASRFREELLPLINARGISTVMIFSRLLLLSQYLISKS